VLDHCDVFQFRMSHWTRASHSGYAAGYGALMHATVEGGVGLFVGFAVGLLVGLVVGFLVGCTLGSGVEGAPVVGRLVGVLLGPWLGCVVGRGVGLLLGARVGVCDGSALGSGVGRAVVGAWLGRVVGRVVGRLLGELEGCSVGEFVGDLVGCLLGRGVGLAVVGDAEQLQGGHHFSTVERKCWMEQREPSTPLALYSAALGAVLQLMSIQSRRAWHWLKEAGKGPEPHATVGLAVAVAAVVGAGVAGAGVVGGGVGTAGTTSRLVHAPRPARLGPKGPIQTRSSLLLMVHSAPPARRRLSRSMPRTLSENSSVTGGAPLGRNARSSAVSEYS